MRKRGFTLLEMLVVISIIGILATLILARLGGAEKAGRDTRRKSDLNQYRIAIENYALKTSGMYPYYASQIRSDNLCSKLVNTYMADCIQDPLYGDGTHVYRYTSNGIGAAGSDSATMYALYVRLENVSTPTNYFVCSTGKIGLKDSSLTITAQVDCQ